MAVDRGALVKLNLVTLAVALLGAVLFAKVVLSYPATPWRIVGLAIAIPSFLLFILARIQLGRAFSVQAKATTLVTTGIYSRIRNPIYVFGALLLLGMIVWVQRPWWLLVLVVLVPLQILRTRKEAQVLEAEFGEAYLEYRRKTWF
jgi:protein-S-isoprenylcysteine O-methyltransferase Ste14